MSVINTVSLQQQIAEVRREIEMRKRVYPRLLDSGKLKVYDAEVQMLTMAAVLHTLVDLRQREVSNDNGGQRI